MVSKGQKLAHMAQKLNMPPRAVWMKLKEGKVNYGGISGTKMELEKITPLYKSPIPVQADPGHKPSEGSGGLAKVEHLERLIQELHGTVGKMENSIQEALERLMAILQEIRTGLRGKRGSAHLKELESKYALELQQLRQVITQKEQEKQQVAEQGRIQLEQVMASLESSYCRMAKLEESLNVKEQQHRKIIAELYQGNQADKPNGGRIANGQDQPGSRHSPNPDFICQFLGTCALFEHLTPFELAILADLACYEEVGANEMITKEGTKADSFYVVVEGKVHLIRDTAGKPVVLATVERGEIFGENSLLSNKCREFTAVSACPTILLRIAYQDYRELSKSNLPRARALIKKLSNNLNRLYSEKSFPTIRTRA